MITFLWLKLISVFQQNPAIVRNWKISVGFNPAEKKPIISGRKRSSIHCFAIPNELVVIR